MSKGTNMSNLEQMKASSLISGENIRDQYTQWVSRTVPETTTTDTVALDETFTVPGTDPSDMMYKIKQLEDNLESLKREIKVK